MSSESLAKSPSEDEQWLPAFELLEWPINSLRLVGLWFPGVGYSRSRPRNVWYYLFFAYAVLHMGCLLWFAASATIYLKTTWRNLEEFTDNLLILTVTLNSITKAWQLLFRRGAVLRALRTLDELVARWGVAERARPSAAQRREALAAWARFFRRASCVVCGSAGFAAGIWMLFPLLTPNGQRVLRCDERGLRCEMRSVWNQPFAGWFPWEARFGGWGYWTAFASQGLSVWFDAMGAASTNCFYLGVMLCAYVCLRALGAALRELRLDDRAQLADVARRHQLVLRFMEEISVFLGPIVFVQSLATSILLCSSILHLTLISTKSVKFYAVAMFLTFEMGELYLYCQMGTELQHQSTKCSVDAYSCLWYDASPQAQRPLVLLIQRMQKPITISGLGFTTLSLDLFTALLQASYSYYALLHQMAD